MGNSLSSTSSKSSSTLTVLSPVELPPPAAAAAVAVAGAGSADGNNNNDLTATRDDARKDALDEFNHPRQRRVGILKSLHGRAGKSNVDIRYQQTTTTMKSEEQSGSAGTLGVYESVHSKQLQQFLLKAWGKWEGLGEQGRDPSGYLMSSPAAASKDESNEGAYGHDNDPPHPPPAFAPTNFPLPRVNGGGGTKQRPSWHVLGQVGYYCTDASTPIFSDLSKELLEDAGVVRAALAQLKSQLRGYDIDTPPVADGGTAVDSGTDAAADGAAATTSTGNQNNSHITGAITMYLLPTHPGHHAARDSFGGYCYVNNAAALAQGIVMMDVDDDDDITPQEEKEKVTDNGDDAKKSDGGGGDQPPRTQTQPASSSKRRTGNNNKNRVAILDVDYHCGNGTASIFENSEDVCVVSVHCDPNYDYPFHAGFAGQSTRNIQHIPLPPGTAWKDYLPALMRGLDTIRHWNPDVVVVSLGVDTHEGDPVALRNAGFKLSGGDYAEMGRTIGHGLSGTGIPIVFVQEGGYHNDMDRLGDASADVVLSCCEARAGGAD